MSIHEQLQRIADRAPTATVPDDTWERARRTRRRNRALLLAGAAVVVLLAAALVWVPTRSEPPVADADSLGVPDHLYVPQNLDATSDLAVGVAAAAWQDYSRVVVVGADGEYHLLEPPGFEDLFGSDQATALSPDGTQLAYTWTDHDLGLTAIRLVDLASGDVRAVPTPSGAVAVEQLTWSPNSRWLGWWGTRITWTGGGGYSGDGDRIAGRIRAGALRSEDVGQVPNDANLSLAISPGGRVLFVSTNGLVQARPGWRDPVRHGFGRLSTSGVVDLDSGMLAVGVGGNGPIDRPRPGTAAVLVNPSTGDQQPLVSTVAGEVMSSPLGFVSGDLLIGVTPIGADGSHGDRRVELVGADREPERVIELDDLVPYDLTIATDLMTSERLTVHRPEPDWPTPFWDVPRFLFLALGSFAVLAVVRVALRHRRRHRPR